MGFLQELLVEGIEFVVMVCIAIGGVFAGIAFRKHKDKKMSSENPSDNK